MKYIVSQRVLFKFTDSDNNDIPRCFLRNTRSTFALVRF